MLRAFATATAISVLLAVDVLAAPTPSGVNLRWDRCYSDGGTMNRSFACDTNAGSERLVMSFVLDSQMDQVCQVDMFLDIRAVDPVLPVWWTMKNTGTCRPTSLTFVTTPPPGTVECVDWSGGHQAGGIGIYAIGEIGPNTVRVRMAGAVAPAYFTTLFAGTEYFAGSLTIDHLKTVGTGACGGCDRPVCLRLDGMVIETCPIQNNRDLREGANGPESQVAHWQNGAVANLGPPCPAGENHFNCTRPFDCVLSPPTAVRGSTWGAVKSLYR